MTPDLAILRHLAERTHASAAAIGTACGMAPAEVRARLVMLESMRLIAGSQAPTFCNSGHDRRGLEEQASAFEKAISRSRS